MLARTFEAAGLSTILVSPMPIWAEKIGVPRTLAIEYPFVQVLGQPHQARQHRQVIEQALHLLETADQPGTIIHAPDLWPQPAAQAIQEWQPSQPSPIAQALAPQIRTLLRQSRGG